MVPIQIIFKIYSLKLILFQKKYKRKFLLYTPDCMYETVLTESIYLLIKKLYDTIIPVLGW